MPSWTDQAETRLLVSILACHDFKCDYEKVAQAMGGGFSANGVRQHIQKLKRTSTGDISGGSRTRSASKRGGAGGNKKRLHMIDNEADDEDEEDDVKPKMERDASPNHGPKKKLRKAKAKVKAQETVSSSESLGTIDGDEVECLGEGPTAAITIIKRETTPWKEASPLNLHDFGYGSDKEASFFDFEKELISHMAGDF